MSWFIERESAGRWNAEEEAEVWWWWYEWEWEETTIAGRCVSVLNVEV